MKCPDCGAELEVIRRDWPSYVQPGAYVLVRTCWECGYKRATHGQDKLTTGEQDKWIAVPQQEEPHDR